MISIDELQTHSLGDLLQAGIEVQRIENLLFTFLCEDNEGVQNFLHNKAIENEKRSHSKTTLVMHAGNKDEIVGYFTLLIKEFAFNNVSKTIKHKLTGNKMANNFITVLIAQLGRSDGYKGKVAGNAILNLALEKCEAIKDLSALRVICVEHDDHERLNSFYEDNGFRELQINRDSEKIIRFVRI